MTATSFSAADSLARSCHGGNRHAAAAIAGCTPNDILDFSASLNPFGPPDSVLEAIANAPQAIANYPDPQSVELRRALARHYALDPEWIMIGNGAAELLTWIARDSAQLGTTHLFTPAFGDYARALKATSAPFVTTAMTDEAGALDPDRALGWLREPLPDVLWINNPHNPTGHLWTRSQLLDVLPRFQLVVADEAFMDFLPGAGESLLADVSDWPQLVVVRSLTKFYAIAGLRVGFVVA
ncbi:MAG: aminotransferase class I/II-fold pyridoxal phosphate-dependent enzyme, partial [Cyanobacteria bacterium J06648_11]